MAQVRRLSESFDLYPNDQNQLGFGLRTRWGGTYPAFGDGLIDGRFQGRAYSGQYNARMFRSFVPDVETCCGFAWRRPGGTVYADVPMMSFLSQDGTYHMTLTYSDDYRVRLRLGDNNGTILKQTSYPVLFNNTWQYVEVEHVLSNDTGEIRVYIDGFLVPELNFNGDTSNHATDVNIGRFMMRFGDNVAHHFDDIYVENGGRNRVGEGRYTLLPADSDISNTNFTPSVGTTLWEALDGVPGAVTPYVEATPAGSIFRVGYKNLDVNPQTIYGVQSITLSQKGEAGTRSGRNKLWSAGVLQNGVEHALQLDSFTFKEDWVARNPNGNIPWVTAAVAAIEGGYEIVV